MSRLNFWNSSANYRRCAQTRENWRFLLIVGLAMGVTAAFTSYDLHRLERVGDGEKKQLMIIVMIEDYLKLILFIRPFVFPALVIPASRNCLPTHLHADESADRCIR